MGCVFTTQSIATIMICAPPMAAQHVSDVPMLLQIVMMVMSVPPILALHLLGACTRQ
jgi:hypothetical protein